MGKPLQETGLRSLLNGDLRSVLVLPSNETLVQSSSWISATPSWVCSESSLQLVQLIKYRPDFSKSGSLFYTPMISDTEYILWGHRGKLTLDFHQRDLVELIGETEIWVKLLFNSNNQTEIKAFRRYFTMIVVTTTVRFSIAELSLDKVFSFWTNTSLSMSFQ